MNAKDLITVLEYTKAFTKPEKAKRWKKDKDLDIITMLRKKQEEAKLIDTFLKDHEKLSKKEEKKDEKKGHAFTFAEGVILAYMAQVIIGPLYKVVLVHLGVQ